METKKILIILYVIVGFGAIFLCGRMINSINRIAPKNIVHFIDDSGYIMSEPDDKSIKLLELEKGDKLELVVKENGWCKVINGPYEGFVRTSSISNIK